MEHRPSPVTDFAHLTDDGLRDHLLACSDWLLAHDDESVRESYRAGREVLRVRIEHAAAARRPAPPPSAPALSVSTSLRSVVVAHLAAGGWATYRAYRHHDRSWETIPVRLVDGELSQPHPTDPARPTCSVPRGVLFELRGLGGLAVLLDDASSIVQAASPAEVVAASERVHRSRDVIQRWCYRMAVDYPFGAADRRRCSTWASSMTPPEHPLTIAVLVTLLAAE